MPRTKKREATPPPTESAPPSMSSPPPSPVKIKKKKKNVDVVANDSDHVSEKPKKSNGQRLRKSLNAAKKAWQGSDVEPSAQASEREASVIASVEAATPKKSKKTTKSKKKKLSTVEEPEPEPEASAPPPEDSEDVPPPEPTEEEEKPKKKKKAKKADDGSKKKKKKRTPTPPPEPSGESEPPVSGASAPVSPPPSSAESIAAAEELAKASNESDGEVESVGDGAPNEDPEVTKRAVANMSMTGLGHMLRNEHRLRHVANPISLTSDAATAASISDAGSEGARDVSDDEGSDAGAASDVDDHDSALGSSIASDNDDAPNKAKTGDKQNSGIGTSSDVDLTESIASFSESEPPQEEQSERSVSEPESEEPESKVPLDVLGEHIPVFMHHSCVDMTVQKHKLLVNRKIRACKYWNYPPKTEPLLQALESAEDDDARDEIAQQLAEKRETALAEEVEAAELLKNWRRYQEDIRDVTEDTQEDLDSHIENHREALGPDLESLVEQPSLIFKELADLWQEEFEFWEGLREDADTGLPKTVPYKFERVHTYPAAFRKAAIQAQLFNLRLGSRLAKIAAHARKLKDDQGTPEEREWLIEFFMDGHDKGTLREWARRLKEDIFIWKGRSAVTRCRFDKK